MTIRSDIAWSTPTAITVRGRDLPGEILGRMDVGAFSFLQLTGREPTAGEARVYNALLVSLVEHGLTPSALAARLTYTGAPEALQAAVGAGLAGLGTVFVGSTEGAAKMISENLGADDLAVAARDLVAGFRERRELVPGVGHPFHKPIDPRTPRLFAIAAEEGLSGRAVQLMELVGEEATRASGRELPVNATGAIGALACELGLPWHAVRGLGVMARAIGLVGHLMEEREHPIGREIWLRADREASAPHVGGDA
jgi:citrate synthase